MERNRPKVGRLRTHATTAPVGSGSRSRAGPEIRSTGGLFLCSAEFEFRIRRPLHPVPPSRVYRMRRDSDNGGNSLVCEPKPPPHSLRWDRPRAATMPGQYDGRQLPRMLPGVTASSYARRREVEEIIICTRQQILSACCVNGRVADGSTPGNGILFFPEPRHSFSNGTTPLRHVGRATCPSLPRRQLWVISPG